VDPNIADLVWRGIEDANPWWRSGRVPPERTRAFRRHAFDTIFEGLRSSERGRGVVVLGPRRVGKTVLVHQIVEELLARGSPPDDICFLAVDDVALRDRDIGELLMLLEARKPRPDRIRTLLLDEVQHAPNWAGWLKRLADRADPYTFLATGSSATALRRGGQDAGVGRWREMTLFPWSFREHVQLRRLAVWSFAWMDRMHAGEGGVADLGSPPPDEAERLDAALADYFLRGGFPEAAVADDLAEARRRLRQDILDRSLGRDILDVVSVDARILERLFLRICLAPGGQWNEANVAQELGISRPTVGKYVQILEEAFLVFRLPNLASPIRGQSKVYLVAPAIRQALLASDEAMVRRPEEWGMLTENVIAGTTVGTRPDASQIGFWRRGLYECDVVVVNPSGLTELLEVKRGGRGAVRGIEVAAAAVGLPSVGFVLARSWPSEELAPVPPLQSLRRYPAVAWLYWQKESAGGTLRLRVG
jgi:uncharacterized protein